MLVAAEFAPPVWRGNVEAGLRATEDYVPLHGTPGPEQPKDPKTDPPARETPGQSVPADPPAQHDPQACDKKPECRP